MCTAKNWQVFLDKEPGWKAGHASFSTSKLVRVYGRQGKIVRRTHEKIKLSRNLSRKNCSSVRGLMVNLSNQYFSDRNVVSAIYRGIFRRGDFNYEVGSAAPVSATEEIKQEFVEIECKILNGRILREFWLQPVPHPHLLERKAKRRPGLPLNVLIVGVDSLSHANARRKLPKFYEYLKNELGALLFNGHSIVGDGTTEQLAAILTGLGELEQYEARRHHRNPRPVDGWAWIYRELTGEIWLVLWLWMVVEKPFIISLHSTHHQSFCDQSMLWSKCMTA